MNSLSVKRILASVLVVLMSLSVCEAQSFNWSAGSGPIKSAKGPIKSKQAKVKKPKSVTKAKKKADAKDKKRRKVSADYIKENQKRSIKIQTPEVQQRMKQNVKDANANYKAKKKNNSTRTRKAGQKYN